MKQKLAVARAVFHRPPLVFLDEPTAGLDPVASAALREDLEQLARSEGVTIFLTTHNLTEAERLCTLVGVIRKGTLVALGPPRDLRTGHDHPVVRISGRGFDALALEDVRQLPIVAAVQALADGMEVRLRDGASPAPIVSLLVGRGAEIDEVRRERPSLEEAFLELVSGDESKGAASK
jgi:ABC-2 type transport system ATP-binding protein